jgi:UDP-N-acetylmuramoylalanine--D-glutamate ligase
MRILIVGLGKEGWSNYQFLRNYLPKDTVFDLVDDGDSTSLTGQWSSEKIVHSDEYLTAVRESPSVAVLAPGIPPSHSLVAWLEKNQVEITNNVQLFLNIVKPSPDKKSVLLPYLPELRHPVKTIGITGTKGKSTTTALLHHVLNQSGFDAFIAGNIGVPALDLISQLQSSSSDSSIAVLELSSHQLSRLTTSPDIATVLHVSADHLDYYDDFEKYLEAKANITRYQAAENLLVYDADSPTATRIAQLSPAQKYTFSTSNPEANCYFKQGVATLKQGQTINLTDLPLVGEHNQKNALVSVLISLHLGANLEQLNTALHSFRGLPHRLQLVHEANGVKFYNDSLATNPQAGSAAVRAFPNQNAILIAGGYDRGIDYTPFAEAIAASTVTHAILLPTTGSKIAESLTKIEHSVKVEQVPDLTVAVTRAKQLAQPGDVVLMSPASASFNQFKDYADRGNQFTQMAKQLVTLTS